MINAPATEGSKKIFMKISTRLISQAGFQPDFKNPGERFK